MIRRVVTAGVVSIGLLGWPEAPTSVISAQAQQRPVVREIVNIAPDLYRAQNGGAYTVFLVTSDGIIMSDPINREFATWLKEELQRRFNKAVRYVLYTHHHWDHASGGGVFADTAQFIGHHNMVDALRLPAGNPALPANAQKMDANGNGTIERNEATQGLQNNFALTDANGDNVLSGAELLRGALNDVHPPTTTFSDRHTVTLGGKTAIMVYLGVAHSPDSSIVYFPAERAIFSADLVQVRRLAGELTPTLGAMTDAMRTVEKLDFDILASGHGLMGKKADVVELRQYYEELATVVSAGIAAGKTVKEIQESSRWDKYKNWERHPVQHQVHITQVYEMIRGSN
jgi:glyoxylase-like metal-dependent hydrolase (beta-lactamase superfamily II)